MNNRYNRDVLVVISTYNGEKHIERQLDSIFDQEQVNVRVLIRDDHSTDNTVAVIKKYQDTHKSCSIDLIEGENLGYAKSFWTALKNCANTDYYAFSDQDDVWKKNKLIRCIESMQYDSNIPQLSYCNMQRSDIFLRKLDEQVDVLPTKKLSKKLTLIKTYNYGAATVINHKARELVCRCWPEVEDLPHDMWVGTLCYWFGKVNYVNEELYYWIRYESSVTGEGTKNTGIKYRVKKTLQKKSYPNICNALLDSYSDLLEAKDKEFLETVKNYKINVKDKMKLLLDPTFKRLSVSGTAALKMGILFGWY